MFFALLLAASQPPVLAVLELRNTLPQEERASVNTAYFSDVVRTASLEIAPQLQVMTRENVLVMLKASGRSLEDCEGECEVDTGRRLGADYVVSGELYRVGPSLKLNLRLHDTHSAALLAGAQAQGADAAELDKALRPAVEKLLARFKGVTRTLAAGALTSPVHLWTTEDGTFSARIVALNGTFDCPNLTATAACDLADTQPGFVRANIGGAASFSHDFTLSPGGAAVRVVYRSWAWRAVPLVGLVAGAVAGGIGAKMVTGTTAVDPGCGNQQWGCADSGARALVIGGGAIALVSLGFLVADLVHGSDGWLLREEKP